MYSIKRNKQRNNQRKHTRKLRKLYGGDKRLTYKDYHIIRHIARKPTIKGVEYFQRVFDKSDATNVYIRAKMSNHTKIIQLLDAAHITYEDKYLIHSFRDISPNVILDSGKLLAISKQTSAITSKWYNENNVNQERADYKNAIFTTLLHKSSQIMPNHYTMYLFLDINLIKDSEDCELNSTYICNTWNFAKYNANCLSYTGDLNDWISFIEKDDKIRMPFGTPDNEVIIKYSKTIDGSCVKGEVALNKYLKAIVVFTNGNNDENTYNGKLLQELYPEFNWIIL